MVIRAQDQRKQFDSIRFLPGAAPSLDHLMMDSAGDLLRARQLTAPAAHIIRISDIDNLKAPADCIVDCGTQKRTGKKGQTIELSRYVLKKGEKIPLVRAVYGEPGRAQQGIRKLLTKAQARSERNLYLIAVQENLYKEILEQLWEKREHRSNQAIFLERIPDDPDLAREFVGRSPEYVNVRKNILVAAEIDLPVLVIGESGTGKEIVARAIHKRSRRSKTGAFVAVNSAAIPGDLLEEELFGVEPGVLPMVTRLKIGLWEAANHGTVFLDEIGDMSLEHQRKILRVLQDGTIRRVGGTRDISVDARVIAATNKDLRESMAKKRFREDLFYRLGVFTIYTPALRGVPEEIEYMAQENWRLITGGSKPPLSREVIRCLSDYALAGNVRTVKNVLSKLYAYMNAEKLERIGEKYFEAAMRTPDRLRPSPQAKRSTNAIHSYRDECIEQLRQASRAIRRCKVVLRAFLRKGCRDGASIRRLQSKLRLPHEELDALCFDPSAFYSHEAFRDVSRFSGKLSNLRQLMDQDPIQAAAYWDTEAHAQYDLALSRIQDEIRELLQGR